MSDLRDADPAFFAPERHVPSFTPGTADIALLEQLTSAIRTGIAASIEAQFRQSHFPQDALRIILILYAPGHKRILVSRQGQEGAAASFSATLARLLAHPRRAALAASDFRLQMDFVTEPPQTVDYYAIGMQPRGERHFEIGIDGLLIRGADNKTHIFPPGDGYVRSTMTMRQVREYLAAVHGEDYLREATFQRFRSDSYLTGNATWLRLYRGYPVVGPVTRDKIMHAVELAIRHIQRTQQADGKFLYYYDAALDTRRDHEHPTRDPDKNPFYNILRHGGGGLTCLFYEKLTRRGDALENIRRAIAYLAAQLRHQEYAGKTGAYIYHEKKAKLGGSGIALYLMAEYQLHTGDTAWQTQADQLAWHLVHQITASGEFIYYNIYLDKPVSEAENSHYFSFYYPGEAICGLAKYLHLADADTRALIFEKLHKALAFLIEVRPVTRADQYTAVPSDAWLMMGIAELWDFPEMQRPQYADFVFSDADKMIAHLYKVSDAPWPDYAGAFYYTHGDYPYADGARCEGLTGALQLATKTGDHTRARTLRQALRLAAWATLHLVNTEDAIYFARNPHLALGGIRFKYTRHWFRIDTIQHVASFYAKMLPFWRDDED